MSLATQLPIELLQEIVTFGVIDPRYGKPFGAKCMRLARWIQTIVAPLLYRMIIIKSKRQMLSFMLALENTNVKHRAYAPAKYVRTLIIEDNEYTSSAVTLDTLYRLAGWFDKSSWKEIHLPLEILYTRERITYDKPFRMPPFVTLSRDSKWYASGVDYTLIIRLRLLHTTTCFKSIADFIRGHAELAPNLSHLAITAYDDPFTSQDITKILDAASNLQCVIVLVIPSNPRYFVEWETEGIRRRMLGIKVPKLVIWEKDAKHDALFRNYDSGMLWAQAESELGDPERKITNLQDPCFRDY